MRVSLRLALFYCLLLPVTPAYSQDAEVEKQSVNSTFVNREANKEFLDSLGKPTRETGKDKVKVRKGLMLALELRLPEIFKTCDVQISHHILKQAYGYATHTSGAERLLRDTANELHQKPDRGFQGTSKNCRAALRGFASAVLRVYLGNDWNVRDDERLQKALQEREEQKTRPRHR